MHGKYTPNLQRKDAMLSLDPFLRFINRAEKELEQETVKSIFVEWAFESNITDHNEKNKLAQQVRIISKVE